MGVAVFGLGWPDGTETTMKTTIFVLASLAALGASANAQPIYVDRDAGRSAHVSVAGINLDTKSGRVLVERRIRGAAEDVCSNEGDRSVASALAVRACFKVAVDDGNRQLSDLIDGSNGVAVASLEVGGY
jgi:UrcA family protein